MLSAFHLWSSLSTRPGIMISASLSTPQWVFSGLNDALCDKVFIHDEANDGHGDLLSRVGSVDAKLDTVITMLQSSSRSAP